MSNENEIFIKEEGLQTESAVFSTAASALRESTLLYATEAKSLKDAWKGAGSSTYASSYMKVVGLFMQTSALLERESGAILTVNERFAEQDNILAKNM